jgi:alkanesulfonate monooxygenase SsuD/methylene tetrahydromethanopterin reductase-like flavin-dependent oxidoreductase (luciferase family)
MLANSMPGTYHEANIVSLGGSKNNPVTADILRSLRDKGVPAPHSDESTLSWPAISDKIYEAETIDGEVVRDYGMLLRARSPYHHDQTVVVLAGASTFGTAAAARYFVEQCAFMRGDFAAIVRADVRNAHVLVPTLVEMMPLATHIPSG